MRKGVDMRNGKRGGDREGERGLDLREKCMKGNGGGKGTGVMNRVNGGYGG